MPEADESYLHHLRGLFHSTEEDFHERIYDFFPGIIYVYNTDSRKLRYVNKKITDVLGFSYDDIKTWDNDFSKIIFKDDVDLVQKELEKFTDLKDDASHTYRCRFNRKEGDWMHFCVVGKVLRRNPDGKPASLLLVAQDVNEQIRSSEELRAIKELAEDNEELLQFGNWNLAPSSGQLRWSRGMYILMDYDPDVQEPQLSLTDYLEFVVAEDRERVASMLQGAVENKETTVDFKYLVKTRHNNEKIFHSKGKIIYNDLGEVTNIIGITRDITESTRLYENLENYRQSVVDKEDFLNHGSWEFDIASNTNFWSDGMYKIFGYSKGDREKLVLDDALFEKHIATDVLAAGRKQMTDKLNSGDSYVWEYEITTKSGDIKVVESFGKIVRDRAGKGLKIIGTTRDVTQLKKYEGELEEKIKELDRSNNELEDFAYAASHDLQEPLRKIATLTDRLQNKFGEVLQEEGKKYIERVQQSVKSARFLIDSLMEFSRITHDSQKFVMTDLNTVLNDAKGDIELKIEETKTVVQSGNLPSLEVAPAQIKQLFSNILLNSIKFRKQDVLPVITISSRALSRAEAQTYHLSPKSNFFAITIQDNGIGFEHEYEQKIFQMFTRLHGKSEYPGAGIGLSLCKKITEHHRGIIFAKGLPGDGAVFTIILPEKHF